ncbi:EthD family reductase [Glutamicibacter halophytocola]|nr:EthD family reductase [Glutamicibacter halophytocola]
MSFSEFSEHWAGPHARIAKELPGLACYLQNHIKQVAGTGAEADEFQIDGIVELWFREPGAFSAASQSQLADRLVEDEQKFLSGLTGGAVVSEEPHEPWFHKLWILGQWREDQGGMEEPLRAWVNTACASIGGLLGTNVNILEPHGDLLTRELLRVDPKIPQIAIALGFSTSSDAESALATLHEELEQQDLMRDIRLLMGVEKIVVAPELSA